MIVSSEAWCTPSEIRGNGDKLISITATQNTLTTARNAIITILWADAELDINVTQERGEDPGLERSVDYGQTVHHQLFPSTESTPSGCQGDGWPYISRLLC